MSLWLRCWLAFNGVGIRRCGNMTDGFLDECEKCGKVEKYEGQFETEGICPECEGELTDD